MILFAPDLLVNCDVVSGLALVPVLELPSTLRVFLYSGVLEKVPGQA